MRRALRLVTAPFARRLTTGAEHHDVFAGGVVYPIVEKLEVKDPTKDPLFPVYRVMNPDGTVRPGAKEPTMDKEELLKFYKLMVHLNGMDHFFNEAQRQGRISFYMQSSGEEAIHFGTASCLRPDDVVYAQYREAGVLMWRGFTVDNFADQCYSNCDDLGKGRQMPVHYGSRDLHFHTISSPLGTQIPQAVGAGYKLKLEGEGRLAVCYFGDGAASEGDFHPALNFAATLDVPVIFVCRNNGYAISTPVKEQYRGDGIVSRAAGYGMRCIRVDGNDLFAVRDVMSLARETAITHSAPVLVEAMTYREGHHSTSDDSTRYRDVEEINAWKARSNPIMRIKAYLYAKRWWTTEENEALIAAEKRTVLAALSRAGAKKRPPFSEMVTDVFDTVPDLLQEQYA